MTDEEKADVESDVDDMVIYVSNRSLVFPDHLQAYYIGKVSTALLKEAAHVAVETTR